MSTKLKQAGGHQLIHKYKNLTIKPTKLSEVIFYNEIMPKYCKELKDFIPQFEGYGNISEPEIRSLFSDEEYDIIISKKYTHYIKLHNLITENENTECIIDIKLGKIHWKSTDSTETIREHQIRNANSIINKHFFRLDGFILNDSISYDKNACRNLKKKEIKELFTKCDFSKQDIEYIIGWVGKLKDVLSNLPVNIYGPSILIIKSQSNLNIKLIDFATHELVNEDSTEEENLIEMHKDILLSLNAISKILQKLQK